MTTSTFGYQTKRSKNFLYFCTALSIIFLGLSAIVDQDFLWKLNSLSVTLLFGLLSIYFYKKSQETYNSNNEKLHNIDEFVKQSRINNENKSSSVPGGVSYKSIITTGELISLYILSLSSKKGWKFDLEQMFQNNPLFCGYIGGMLHYMASHTEMEMHIICKGFKFHLKHLGKLDPKEHINPIIKDKNWTYIKNMIDDYFNCTSGATGK